MFTSSMTEYMKPLGTILHPIDDPLLVKNQCDTTWIVAEWTLDTAEIYGWPGFMSPPAVLILPLQLTLRGVVRKPGSICSLKDKEV